MSERTLVLKGEEPPLSQRLLGSSEIGKCLLTTQIAEGFEGNTLVHGRIQRGGARPSRYKPLHPGAWTEHSFGTTDLFAVVSHTIQTFDKVLRYGTYSPHYTTESKIPALYRSILEFVSVGSPEAPRSLPKIIETNVYRSMIGMMLTMPYTIPAVRSMLKVGAFGGIDTACANMYTQTTAAINFVSQQPQSENIWALNGLRTLSYIMRPHATSSVFKFAAATEAKLRSLYETFEAGVGGQAALALYDNPGLFLEHGRRLLQSHSRAEQSTGTMFLSFAMDIERVIQSDIHNFMGNHVVDPQNPQSPMYEVACVGHKLVNTIAEQSSVALLGLVLSTLPSDHTRLQSCNVIPERTKDRDPFRAYVEHMYKGLNRFLKEDLKYLHKDREDASLIMYIGHLVSSAPYCYTDTSSPFVTALRTVSLFPNKSIA